MILLALLLFVSGIITDVIWALYIRHVAAGNMLKGAIYSAGTGACTIILIQGVQENIWLTPFWLIGLFLGTYYSQHIEQFFRRFFNV